MFKLFIFTIFFVASPTFGLIEALYQTENDCYSGCHSNYADNLLNLNGCKQGCGYKLYYENCADQCKLFLIQEQVQASCVVGCSMGHTEIKQSIEKPHVQSIVLIHQRPSLRLPLFNSDPVETVNKIIKQFKEDSTLIEPSNELKPIFDLVKSIPVIKSSNEDNIKKFKLLIHEENTLNQLMKNIRSKRRQLPIFILLSIFLITSTILLFMIISLCRKTPRHHNLSIHAEELIFEKDLIQPNKLSHV